MSRKQTRIFLWAVPRSISTAFLRAMSNRKNTEVLLEPYACPYFLGPSRVSLRYQSESINDADTFKNIQALCELPYPDANEVVVKDMAYYLVKQPHTDTHYSDLLPSGYIHTFIIRNPAKSIPSFYKLCINKELTGSDYFEPSEVGFRELYEMFVYVTTELGQEAIIVDGDDLRAQPEDMLRQYCTRVGIEFQQSMVDWEDDRQNNIVCKEWQPEWFMRALNSKRLEPNGTKPSSPLVMPTLPQDVQEAINDSMPYYDKMYALRIKPMLGTI